MIAHYPRLLLASAACVLACTPDTEPSQLPSPEGPPAHEHAVALDAAVSLDAVVVPVESSVSQPSMMDDAVVRDTAVVTSSETGTTRAGGDASATGISADADVHVVRADSSAPSPTPTLARTHCRPNGGLGHCPTSAGFEYSCDSRQSPSPPAADCVPPSVPISDGDLWCCPVPLCALALTPGACRASESSFSCASDATIPSGCRDAGADDLGIRHVCCP